MKPEAIGCKYFKKLSCKVPGKFEINNAKAVINKQAGVIQTARVKKANFGPPILNPIAVIVWVEVGPGKMLHNEFNSINSSSVR